MTTVRVFVTYKPSVFDPQGAAITDAVHTLGHDEVNDIAVGRFFDLRLAADEGELDAIVKEVAERLLVNFNMETYHYQVLEATE